MSQTGQGWTVIDEKAGILTREYTFAPKAYARMVTARLNSGKLVALSPASRLPDAALRELEDFGGVGALVATNGFHYMGIPEWSRAFPDAPVFAPAAGQKRITKKLGGGPPLLGLEGLSPMLPAGTRVYEVPGQRIGETWLTAKSAKGPVWYVSDSCFSMESLPAQWFARLLFKWSRSAPGLQINGLGLKMFVTDRKAYRAWFLDRLAEEAPETLMTAHGKVLQGVVDELRRQAEARL